MAGLTFKGDLNNISDRQLEFIKSVIEQRGYKSNNVVIEAIGEAGDNYMANVKRIIVEDSNGGTFKMVAKIATNFSSLRQLSNTELLFSNEHIMYTKVLPKFSQLEESADIPVQERLRYAVCYGSLEEAPNEVILLEDLKESNYEMLDRFQSLSTDCIKSVLKNFASLHSLSYALKYKEPELYEEYANSLIDMWSSMAALENTELYFKQMEQAAESVLETDIHKKMVSNSIIGALRQSVKMSNKDKTAKHTIIQQGDAWTNNIMFKFDGANLLDSVMIDYQVSKPSSPVCDLLYMIFNCSDYESRKEHFYDWIDYYHNELDKALNNHGLKASYVYSKDQLDVDLKCYGRICFAHVIILAGVISIKTEDASEIKAAMELADMDEMLKNSDVGNKDPETVAIYKRRIEGIIDNFLEFGLLS